MDEHEEKMFDVKGDCFRAAMLLLIDWEIMGRKPAEIRGRVQLVHGIPLGTGGNAYGLRFAHAWVEADVIIDGHRMTYVFDHANGKKRKVPALVYYAIGRINAEECERYSKDEAAKLCLDAKHYGPWHEKFDSAH